MNITKKHLARRAFLRGAGAALALPFLDAMVPAFASTAGEQPVTRMGFVYVPNGIISADWLPDDRRRGLRVQHHDEGA